MGSYVFVTVGVAGSGKSTYVKNQIDEIEEYGFGSTKYISSDKYRINMFGSLEEGNKKSGEVFDRMKIDLVNALENDIKYIYYDATNLSRRKRRNLYSVIKKANEDVEVVILYFSLPLKKIKAMNSQREGFERVPDDVIERMYFNQQIPRKLVDCDRIVVLGDQLCMTYGQGYRDLDSLLRTVDDLWYNELSLVKQPHDNPHHLESIDEHINMTITNTDVGISDELYYRQLKKMKIIAQFHDLGKGITKKIGNDGVARYFGHANVSASYYLNYAFYRNGGAIYEYDEDVAEAIFQHMNGHQGMGDKNIRNNKLDDNLLRIIEEFAFIDSVSRITE